VFTPYGSTGCSTNEEFSHAGALFKAAGERKFTIGFANGPKIIGFWTSENKYRDCVFSMQ
jgi:hypothetical protein